MFGACEKPMRPLPRRRPPPHERQSRGPQSCPFNYLHLGRAPGEDYCAKRLPEYKRRKSEEKEGFVDDITDRLRTRRQNMIEKADSKKIFRNILEQVNFGMKGYERDLTVRREKLRAMLLLEEQALTREIVDQAQRGAEDRLNEMRAKVAELKARNEKDHANLVEEKIRQQYINMSDTARSLASYEALIDTKQAQLMQIEDKKQQAAVEKAVDDMWHQVMLKGLDAWKEREDREEEERRFKSICCKEMLEKQHADIMESKRTGELGVMLAAERKEAQDAIQQAKQDAIDERINRLASQKKRAQELDDQIKENHLYQDREKTNLRDIDETFLCMGKKQMEDDEKRLMDLKSTMKRETLMYLDYLKNLRKQHADAAKIEDVLIEEARSAAEKVVNASRRAAQEASRKLFQDTLIGRAEQVQDQECYRSLVKKLKCQEESTMKDMFDQATRLDEEYQRRLHEEQLQFARELKEQIDDIECRRQRDKFDDENLDRMDDIERQRQDALGIDAVNQLKKDGGGKAHPFRKVLNESCPCKDNPLIRKCRTCGCEK